MNSQQLAATFKAACMAELEALKPGNVHIFADGHGMTVQDLIKSAEVVSEVITQPNLGLGERIFASVQATQDLVGLNTNLGIILLCAPLIHAALIVGDKTYYLTKLFGVLANTTQKDADDTFKAIALANPAGLGSSKYDVHQPANCTLLQAMQEAASRDMIAQQYTNNFSDVLDGLACYQHAFALWQRPAWATTAAHLHYMAKFKDSHITRKYGDTIAGLVQNEAIAHEEEFLKAYNPKNYQTALLGFDSALKKRGLNPGTSADLTVATLLLHALM